MDVSTATAALLTVAGLIGFLMLLRVLDASPRDSAERKLKRLRR